MASLNHWSLDKSTDTSEVTAFGDTVKQYVQGLPDLKGTLSGFLDTADDSLFDAAESIDGCRIYLYPKASYPTMYHYGPAWLSASIDVPSSGPATVTASFVGNGLWGRRP